MLETGVADRVKQGVELARAGDRVQARLLLLQAVEDDRTNESAWMWLASVAESPQEALTTLERVLALNPNHEHALAAVHAARLKVGVAAAKAHKKGRARELLQAVIGVEPDNELAWMWLANIADSPAEAATCLEKVLAINPANDLARATYDRCRSSTHEARPATPAREIESKSARDQGDVREVQSKPAPTVLIVDDDQDVREALSCVLVDGGYQIIAAADGFEAIAILRDHGAPDLILLAAALPGGMDGYQLCKCLRENVGTVHMPMVLLSETSSFVSRMRGRLAGAAAELVKPFEASELLRVVNELCPHKAN